ncbi:MAG TPA: hypothetical protein VGA99_00610, partial [bacterium]
LSVLKAGGVEYILTSSDNYERYFAATAPKAGTPLSFIHQNGRRFYETVFNSPELALVREFKPSTWNLGPTIRIYKFRN